MSVNTKISVSPLNKDLKNFLDVAKTSASDAGLNKAFIAVITPIIQSKSIRGGKPYGALLTLLFDKESLEFVKTGSVAIGSIQRGLNIVENGVLPDTLKECQALEQKQLIEGTNRTQSGKSVYEFVKYWFETKQTIVFSDETKETVNFAFDDNSNIIYEGTTIRKRDFFTTDENEKVYEGINEILLDVIEEKDYANANTFFAESGIDFQITKTVTDSKPETEDKKTTGKKAS